MSSGRRPTAHEVLRDAAEEALAGSLCASAWLSDHNILFLGFGPEVVPEFNAEGWHTRPPYELQTLSDWWHASADGERVVKSDGQDAACRVVEAFIGQAVVGWKLIAARRLRIEFGNGYLAVEPRCEVDPTTTWGDDYHWELWLPGDKYVVVGPAGSVVVKRGSGASGASETFHAPT